MKKNLYLILLLAAFCSFGAGAQTYSYFKSTGVTSPYYPNNLSNVGTTILGSDANANVDDKLSAWQTLPFPFTFYGTKVTGYFASDNGYITFNASANQSIATNDSLPSRLDKAPHNSIFAFWQDLVLPQTVTNSSNNAKYAFSVHNYTYGFAPNRVHVIQWFGATAKGVTPSDYQESIFFSIRIYECGDFDIVQDYKGTSVSTTFKATIGTLSPDGKTGTMVAGSPNIDFPAVNGNGVQSLAVVYSFIGSTSKYDLSLNSVDNIKSIYANNASVNVTGKIQNLGADTITSFTVQYQVDNNPKQSIIMSYVYLAPNAITSFDFTAGGASAISVTPGPHTLKVWIKDSSLVQGSGTHPDDRGCNNVITQHFTGQLGTSKIKMTPLMEYFTGAWCGYCPNGEHAAEDLLGKYPEAPVVAIHGPLSYGVANDGMMVQASGPITNAFNGGFPSATFNRSVLSISGQNSIYWSYGSLTDPTGWAPIYASVSQFYTPVNVTSTVTYDSTKKTANVTVKANYADYPQPGDQRITLYVVEDNLTSTGQGWDQHNYMYATTGSPYYHVGTPDPASNNQFSWIKGFVHHRVLRAILPSDNEQTSPYSPTWGDSGIIPAKVTLNQDYTATYSNIDMSGYNPKNVIFIAFVNNFDPLNLGNMNVQNATVSTRLIPTGIAEQTKATNFVSVYPNPANDNFNATFKLDKATKVSFELYNILGQKVMSMPAEVRPSGDNTMQINTSTLAPGVYNLNMTTSSGTSTERIIIAR